MDKKVDSKTLSIRLDDITKAKLQVIMESRGLSKTEAAKYAIKGIPILKLGNIENLADEFCKLRSAVENREPEDVIKKEVDRLCQYMYDLIIKVEKVTE